MYEIKTDIEKKLLDWYWQHGSQRQGDWQLSRGGWLDRALKLVNEAAAVHIAKTVYSKPTMALWGPSQSGKSTLLARFIDAEASEDGHGSALSWDESAPARFSGDNKGGTVAVLNPFNQGDDASGCVTRFQLRDSVEFPQYPVEIEFASVQDILLSLAVGYMGETEAKDKDGKEVHWDAESLEALAKEACGDAKRATSVPNQGAYKLLTDVFNVVDVLIDMESPRYINLNKEWISRRASLLDNNALVSDPAIVERFAASLLWDKWDSLTEVFKKLCAKRLQLGDKRYFCSLEMAALMLNISAARYYRSSEYVRSLVDNCCVEELNNGTVALTRGKGSRLFSGNIELEFALAQGLVSLIVVPLKKSVIQSVNPQVADLLGQADLVDFPGVAIRHKSVELLKEKDLVLDAKPKGDELPLPALTRVLKRGKTASIVVGYARNLNIDVFSLLVRMPSGSGSPANPRQLMDGIRSWFKSMGKKYTPLDRSRELPINLILTFSATLLNMVHASGTGVSGLVGVFDKLRDMGDLSSPEIVKTFCVNYPMFPDGKIQITDEAELREVIGKILDDPFFKKQFAGTEKSLEEMAAPEADGRFGGRLYLFESMCAQLRESKRQNLLDEKMAAIAKAWNEALAEALPTDSPETKRSSDLEKLITFVNNSTLPPPELSRHILDFEDLKAEELEVLPRGGRQMKDYVARQINIWLESSKRKPLQAELGFESAEHRTRVLGYIRENVRATDLTDWLTQLAGLVSNDERRECRRLVAAFLVNQLFPVKASHREETECVRVLDDMSNDNGEENFDPYRESVVAPFVNVLEILKTPVDARQRGDQPGDRELTEIIA